MLFNELRKHHRLAAKRHPMYEKNRFGKFFMYFMSVFWRATSSSSAQLLHLLLPKEYPTWNLIMC